MPSVILIIYSAGPTLLLNDHNYVQRTKKSQNVFGTFD